MKISSINTSKTIYDCIIVGGGASGLFTAIHARLSGAAVLVLEKNEICGKKLSITGGGRCNIWNEELDLRVLASQYKGSDDLLMSALSSYGVTYNKEFFENIGIRTKVENFKRAFPVKDSSVFVRDTLVNECVRLGINIMTKVTVSSIKKNLNTFSVNTDIGEYKSKNLVLACGGISHPNTGSTGDGFMFAESLGHKIVKPTPSLAPLLSDDDWCYGLSGVSLLGIMYDVCIDGVRYFKSSKQETSSSRILFTHDGLSGPSMINLSPTISSYLHEGEVSVGLYLFGNTDEGEMRAKFLDHLDDNKNKDLSNAILQFPYGNVLVKYLSNKYDLSIKVHSLSKETRNKIVRDMLRVDVGIRGVKGDTHAIITDGGISLSDVDTKTFESKIKKGLYITGDMLNIKRPSGGYSLLLAWSTGASVGIDIGNKIN